MTFRRRLLAAVLPILAVSAPSLSAQGDSFLWSIEDDGNTVYILGSVHMLPASAYPLPAIYDSAFADADELVLELDLDPEEMMVQMFSLLGEVMIPGGKTLKDVLSPEAYTEVRAYLDRQSADIPQMAAMMERMRPWMIGMMAQLDHSGAAGLEADKGVEIYFLEKAVESDIDISGLETMQDQIAVFSDMSAEAEEEFMLNSLRGGVEAVAGLEEIVAAWKQGDLDGLASLLHDELSATPELHQRLLVARNQKWIAPIVERIEGDRNVLIVVGAGHLVGPGNVIELLSDRGYTFSRH